MIAGNSTGESTGLVVGEVASEFENAIDALNYIRFTRASIGTSVDFNGNIVESAANVPSYDYSNGKRALLCENAATNYCQASDEIVNGVSGWVLSGVSGVQGQLSPANDMTATRLTRTSPSAFQAVYYIGASTQSSYTYSEYFRAGTSDDILLRVYNATTATFIKLPSAVLINTGEQVANGYYRHKLTVQTTDGYTIGDELRFYAYVVNATVGEYLDAWGAQIESGLTATSLIRTDGGIGTRAADIAYIPNLPPMPNGFTVYMEAQLDGVVGTFDRLFQLDNGLNTERIVLLYGSATTTFSASTTIGGTATSIFSNNTIALGDRFTLAWRVDTDNTNAAYDGVLGTNDTSCTYTVPTTLYLAASNIAGSNKPARLLINKLLIVRNPATDAALEGWQG